MTQDYWGSAAGVVIEHRCVGQGQEPVMSTAPTDERGERESKKQIKTCHLARGQPARHRDHDSAGLGSFLQTVYFCISCLKYMILVSEYCYTVY